VVNWRDWENPEAGGAEVHLREIFRRVAAAGHEVTVLAHRFRGSAPEARVEGMRVLRTGGKFDFNFRAGPHVRRLLRTERFDVVVEDLNKLPFFLPWIADVPCCAILHHFFGSSIWKETNPLFAGYVAFGEWIVRRTYRGVPFCAVSESTAEDLERGGVPRGRIRIIHNAVDHEACVPDPRVLPEPGRVVYLGRVKRYKGVDLLIRALRRLRASVSGAHLVVVGQGDDLQRLRRIAKESGLADAVTFTGFVDTATKVEHLRRAQVVVTPSPKEGWGVTTIEANACGTPVIASDVPGLRDAVRHDETGLLFPYGDGAALTAAMERVLTDGLLRERLSRGALAWAGRFRWERSAEETVAWLEETAAAARP
jgi:glycosyltransferase involved in cell wall biosynthesis